MHHQIIVKNKKIYTLIVLVFGIYYSVAQQDTTIELGEVIISGNRFEGLRKQSTTQVSLLKREVFTAQQSISIAEGLAFQSGLRVENNCQNCGFTQLRMNGLEGAYSQILVNNRPVFSALTQVYGLELIPASIIERVEVVKGGGSSLYGGNAIAGTLNIITRIPQENATEVSTYTGLIGGKSWEQNDHINTSLVSKDKQKGMLLYGGHRDRQALDIDGDGFTELANMRATHIGAQGFWNVNKQNQLRIDALYINEFRRGGDRLNLRPNVVDIAEQLNHDLLQIGVQHDYQSNSNKWKINNYISAMHTKRGSYYGGLGGGRTAEDTLAASNAFGSTSDFTLIGGSALNYRVKTASILTVGAEFIYNQLEDEIPGYSKVTSQKALTSSAFVQYDMALGKKWNLLTGLRLDYVQLEGAYQIDNEFRNNDLSVPVLSPRATLMYKPSSHQRVRMSYARGFRAPQVFNEDLHVDMAAGEPRFSILGDPIQVEISDAFTLSTDFDFYLFGKKTNWVSEVFFTELYNPFVSVTTDIQLLNGSLLEEVRNGTAAFVTGLNVELNQNISPALQWSAGFTLQLARYRESQAIYEDEENPENSLFVSDFLRTPQNYGYARLKWLPSPKNAIDLTAQYTGSMQVARVVNTDTELIQVINTEQFMDVHVRYTRFVVQKSAFNMELNAGVVNIFNSFQREFDQGPERDAGFFYGPLRPRTIYLGLKAKF